MGGGCFGGMGGGGGVTVFAIPSQKYETRRWVVRSMCSWVRCSCPCPCSCSCAHTALNPPEAAVAAYAIDYIKVRVYVHVYVYVDVDVDMPRLRRGKTTRGGGGSVEGSQRGVPWMGGRGRGSC